MQCEVQKSIIILNDGSNDGWSFQDCSTEACEMKINFNYFTSKSIYEKLVKFTPTLICIHNTILCFPCIIHSSTETWIVKVEMLKKQNLHIPILDTLCLVGLVSNNKMLKFKKQIAQYFVAIGMSKTNTVAATLWSSNIFGQYDL